MATVAEPAEGAGTAAPATASQGGSGSSLVTTLLNGWKAAIDNAPTALADALGLWYAARAALQTVASGVAAAVSQDTINQALAKYTYVPLSPAAIGVAAVRNVVPDPTGATGKPPPEYPPAQFPSIDSHDIVAEAALSGMDLARLEVLLASTGESYGVIDALRLYNRYKGLWATAPNPDYTPGAPLYVAGTDLGPAWGIPLSEFDTVVARSDIRPEFVPDLLLLAKDSVTPADVVMMAVKEILDMPTATDLYAAVGGFPEQFPALVDAAGDAAGIEKAVALWMHGAITTSELTQILAMSRVNPRFYSLYTPLPSTAGPVVPGQAVDAAAPTTWETGWQIAANAKYLGAFEIGDLVKNGDITADVALQWLLQEGYPTDQAQTYASLGGKPSDAVKQQTEAMVLDEYAAGMYTQAQATAALTNMGYTAAAIPVILASAAARMSIAARNEAVNRVKAAYLRGNITSNQVAIDLAELNIPATAITAYLGAWGVELATPTGHLSPSEIGWFLERGFLTPAQATARWQAGGLSAPDAQLLLNRYPANSVHSSANPAPTA